MEKYLVDLECKDGSWCGANEFNSLEEALKVFKSEEEDKSNKKHYKSVCLSRLENEDYTNATVLMSYYF